MQLHSHYLKQTRAIVVLFALLLGWMLPNTARAQCGYAAGLGCSTTDYSNYGFGSSTPNTLEYDNVVSGYHSTIGRNSDGKLMIWGERAASNGSNHVTAPQEINSTNYPALTGVPFRFTIGCDNDVQHFVLTTTGLFVWGLEGVVLDNSLTPSNGMHKLTIGGQSNGLPAGVSPADVKMMFATGGTLAIVTCSGAGYVLSSINPRMRGDGTTTMTKALRTTWSRVKTSITTDLNNIVAIRGNYNTLMALTNTGQVYTWGESTLLGTENSSTQSGRAYATQMTLPEANTVKMIGVTSDGNSTGNSTYYLLYTNGHLYAMGANGEGQLGDFTNNASPSSSTRRWVQPTYTNGGTAMNDVQWMSPNEHDPANASINIITTNKKLWCWGNNSASMLGRIGSPLDPGQPTAAGSFNPTTSNILTVKTGGHTTVMLQECQNQFGYVGHATNGSAGNSAKTNYTSYTFSTAAIQVCGAITIPDITFTSIVPLTGATGKYCAQQTIALVGTPAGGTFSIVSGPGSLTGGNVLNFTSFGGASATVTVRYNVATSPCNPTYTDKSFDIENCTVYNVTGNVWQDINGNAIKEGSENGTNPSGGSIAGMWVNLVNASGDVVASTAVQSNGTYSLPTLVLGTYSVILTNTSIGVGTSAASSITAAETALPTNWAHTGTNNNGTANTSGTHTITGVVVTASGAPNINFGVIGTNVDAVNDNLSSVNGFVGGTTASVIVNDSLNGVVVNPSSVNITPGASPHTGLTMNSNGTVTVLAGTPAGTYSYPYTICLVAKPAVCDNATATVNVGAAPIVALNDNLSSVNGFVGGTTASVLVNDSLNGVAVNPSSVTVTPGTSPHTGLTMNLNGTVTVAAGTPAGSYSYPYTICENLNPTNCSTATATVNVGAAPIVALNDNLPSIIGAVGGTTASVLVNDSLNGVAVNPSSVTVTPGTSPHSGLTMNLNGTVTVAAGTPAGSYSYPYTVCENLNPTNCSTATATVNVGAATIKALPDNLPAVNGTIGGSIATSVLLNDSLNGVQVNPFLINLTPGSAPHAGISMSSTGIVSVAPGTPAGTYTYPYTICEKATPSNCSTATATVVVNASTPIVAVPDNMPSVSGATGGITSSVLNNDLLNGAILIPTQVSLTPLASPHSGITMGTDGRITIAPATPSGTYTYNYTICEALNSSNCSTTSAIVNVGNTTNIAANTDNVPPVNTTSGGTSAASVLDNDLLNGAPVIPSQVTLTPGTSPQSGITMGGNGKITIAPSTTPGTYSYPYTICEIANPSNCSNSTATVIVAGASSSNNIIAITENMPPINGSVGGTTTGSVLDNDLLNGALVVPSQVALTPGTPSNPGLSMNSSGTITVAPNTPAGIYSFPYTICEIANPTNCASIAATVNVGMAPIVAVNDNLPSVSGYLGGTTASVLVNDSLNGVAVNPSSVTVTPGTSPHLGLSMNSSGIVTVAAGTPAGSYSYPYTVCENLNPTNCSTATATVNVFNPTITGITGLCEGSTSQLTGSGTAAAVNPWVSSNPSIATVDATGLVTAQAAGSANIIYTDNNGFSNATAVTVHLKPVITAPATICLKDVVTLSATGTPDQTLPWAVDNTLRATITNTGEVTTLAAGNINVFFTTNNGCKDTATVNILPLPTVNAGQDISICQVDTAFATAFVNGASADPTVTDLTWSTYNGTGTFANNATATALSTTTYKATTADHNATPAGADLVLTATALNGCKASDTMHLDIRITYTWKGGVSEDFGTAANWLLNCVPPQYANINFASNVVNICKLDQHRYLTNITNDSNATAATNILDLNGKRLTVVGQLSFPTAATTGKINAEDGLDTMEFRGVSPYYATAFNQVIPNNVFTNRTVSNLRFDNVAGVTEQDSIYITHTLQPMLGNYYSGEKLTLRSTRNLTARVTEITNTNTTMITGKVVIERFIPGDSNRAWRILSAGIQASPTAQTIFQSWQENMRAMTGTNYQVGYGTFISRPFAGIYNGYDSSSHSPSLKYWDGTQLVVPFSTSLPTTDKITDNGGVWFLFVRGDKTIRPDYYLSPTIPYNGYTTLRQTGILNQGDVTVGQPGTNFSMIPNPYASPVDLDAVGNENGVGIFYVWDSKLNTIGGYRTLMKMEGGVFIATPSTGDNTDDDKLRYLQSGQGFFIPGNKQLEFTESMKAGNEFTYDVYKTTTLQKELVAELHNVTNASAPYQVDGFRIYIDSSYSNNYVANEDVLKAVNVNECLAVAADTQRVVINKRQAPLATDTIQLKFWQTTLSSYKLSFTSNNFGNNMTASLIDQYTNTVTPLSNTGTTDYNFTVTSATGSWNINRFLITLTSTNPLAMTDIRLSAEKRAEGARLQWQATSQKEVSHYEVERSEDGKEFRKIQTIGRLGDNTARSYTWTDVLPIEQTAYYRIKGVSTSTQYVYSNIAQLHAGKGIGSIAVYPNPVTSQLFNVTLRDIAKGNYTVALYTEQGQLVETRTLEHGGATVDYPITLQNTMAAGTYMLKLMDGSTVLHTQRVIMKK